MNPLLMSVDATSASHVHVAYEGCQTLGQPVSDDGEESGLEVGEVDFARPERAAPDDGHGGVARVRRLERVQDEVEAEFAHLLHRRVGA